MRRGKGERKKMVNKKTLCFQKRSEKSATNDRFKKSYRKKRDNNNNGYRHIIIIIIFIITRA